PLNLARWRLIQLSLPITASRTASSMIAKGAATRTRPLGGYTPRCRFLMGWRTTSTASPPTVICHRSVVTLILHQVEDALSERLVRQHRLHGVSDLLFLYLVPAPTVLVGHAHGVIHLGRQCLVLAKAVVERPLRGGVERIGVVLLCCRVLGLLRQLDQLGEVALVIQCVVLP